jgi:transketolase
VYSDLKRAAYEARLLALGMCHRAGSSHIGSILSAVEVMTYIFSSGGSLRCTEPNGDIFILSKGHAAAGLYAVLQLAGVLEPTDLDLYCVDDSALIGHASHVVPGVHVSTGSLGHGVGIATGIALSMRESKAGTRCIALVSDGECDEGSTWEAALLAGQLELENLAVVVDRNGVQGLGSTETIVRLEPFADKWRSFGWHVSEVDGHDFNALDSAFRTSTSRRPHCIVAHTTKGRGIQFMEDQVEWHYRSPTAFELEDALNELRRRYGDS